MSIVLIVIGLVILIGVSITAGVVLAGERLRIAVLKHDARHRRLWRWEQELLTAASVRGCPSCALLRARTDLQHTLDD